MADSIDEYGYLDKSVAVCPDCSKQVLLVDEESEIYFCSDDEMNKGCGWSGKFCELDF